MTSAASDGARLPPAVLVLLLGAAGAYFALSLRYGVELADSGMILLPSRRVLDGAVPYRDFLHLYGPSLFYLNGALLYLTGSDLHALRWAVLAAKLLTVAAVYLCARCVASRPAALAAAALTTVIWGAPWWLFTTPYANHYALTLCLAGLWLSLALPARSIVRCAAAGLCFGLAATFKQTSGLFGLLALCLSLLLAPGAGGAAAAWLEGRLGAAIRWSVVAATAGLLVAYLAPRNEPGTLLVVGVPAAALLVLTARSEWRGTAPSERAAGAAAVLAAAAAAAVPLLCYLVFFAVQDGLAAFVFSTTAGLPQHMRWFDPYFLPAWPGWAAAAAVVALAAAVHGRRRAAWALAGVAALAILVARVAGVESWSGIWFGALALLLPAVVWAALGVLATTARPPAALVRFAAFGAISLLFLYPSGDFWHVAMTAPAFLPLAAGLGDRWLRGRRPAGVVAALVVALVASPFVYALAATVAAGGVAPTSGPLRGLVDSSPRADATRAVVERLRQQPHRPLLVTSGESLLALLAARDSALPADEFVLYLISFGLIDDQVARDLLPESRVLAVLQAERPTLVEAAPTGQAFRRVYPRSAALIDRHYRVVLAAAPFQVLEWMP